MTRERQIALFEFPIFILEIINSFTFEFHCPKIILVSVLFFNDFHSMALNFDSLKSTEYALLGTKILSILAQKILAVRPSIFSFEKDFD